MQDSAYLGDLGGLSGRRRLVLLDLRGTGRSAEPQDPTSWRCDRLVDDVEALRRHLGVDRLDLLAHSGGANLAVLYAARHPERLRQLLLVAPGLAAAGVDVPGSTRRAVARLRARETWFPAAFSALERVTSGAGADDDWAAIAPFFYGRWDAVARAHHAAGEHQRNDRAAAVFGSAGPSTRRRPGSRWRGWRGPRPWCWRARSTSTHRPVVLPSSRRASLGASWSSSPVPATSRGSTPRLTSPPSREHSWHGRGARRRRELTSGDP